MIIRKASGVSIKQETSIYKVAPLVYNNSGLLCIHIMPKQFRYQAVNLEGKLLSGVVDAPGVVTAKQSLEQLGLKVRDIHEVVETIAAPDARPKFKFLAIDPKGKKVWGSVASTDRLTAYSTLTTKYNFEIQYLHPENAAPDEIKKWQEQGVSNLRQALIDQRRQESEDLDKAISQASVIIQRTSDLLHQTPHQEVVNRLTKALKELQTVLQKKDKKDIFERSQTLLELVQTEEIAWAQEQTQQEKAGVTSNTQEAMSSIRAEFNDEPHLSQAVFHRLAEDLNSLALWVLSFYFGYFILAMVSLPHGWPLPKGFVQNSFNSILLLKVAFLPVLIWWATNYLKTEQPRRTQLTIGGLTVFLVIVLLTI